MKQFYLLGLLGLWIGINSICFAQMSTFPSPPPLPSASEPSTNSPSAVSVAPDFGIPNQGQSDNSKASTSSSTDLSAANSTDLIPTTAGLLISMAALDDKIVLQPGDRISFRVIEDKDAAVPRIVTDTGEVDFPYIGRIKVEGQTCHQVAIELKRLLEVDYYKQATVIVGLDVLADRNKDKPKISDFAWVVGQVRQVGPQELSKDRPLTVSQIILRAGGFGDFADQRKVKIVHRSSPSPTPVAETPEDVTNAKDIDIIDVKAVFDGQSAIDPIVKPNDYIIVSKRLVNF
jgi:protein involved in polysaccharide export with SLBB domain